MIKQSNQNAYCQVAKQQENTTWVPQKIFHTKNASKLKGKR